MQSSQNDLAYPDSLSSLLSFNSLNGKAKG